MTNVRASKVSLMVHCKKRQALRKLSHNGALVPCLEIMFMTMWYACGHNGFDLCIPVYCPQKLKANSHVELPMLNNLVWKWKNNMLPSMSSPHYDHKCAVQRILYFVLRLNFTISSLISFINRDKKLVMPSFQQNGLT